MPKRSLTIGIIEDDIIFSYYLKQLLEQDGHKVIIDNNGSTAPKTLLNSEVDIAIMDINLGSAKDGIEIMKEVISKRPLPHIYCTAYSEHSIIEKALNTQPLKICRKPVNEIELLVLINSAA